MVSPQAKRSAVKYLVSERSYSERGACKVVGIGRSSVHGIKQRRAQRKLKLGVAFGTLLIVILDKGIEESEYSSSERAHR